MEAPTRPTIRQCYEESPYLSIKHSTYFSVYDELLTPFRDRPITFVEIGVLHGGSLAMWRRFLGPSARIIGVDLDPGAKRWEADGFEIAIGDQGDPAFWAEFFARVGPVHVLLDDGGHTNRQQVVTVVSALPQIRDGGLLIVEDVHASYLADFGNPSRWSFMSYVRRVIDAIQTRYPELSASRPAIAGLVYSVLCYESIVAFRIDRSRCVESTPTTNHGREMGAEDRRVETIRPRGPLLDVVRAMVGPPHSRRAALARTLSLALLRRRLRAESAALRRYFL